MLQKTSLKEGQYELWACRSTDKLSAARLSRGMSSSLTTPIRSAQTGGQRSGALEGDLKYHGGPLLCDAQGHSQHWFQGSKLKLEFFHSVLTAFSLHRNTLLTGGDFPNSGAKHPTSRAKHPTLRAKHPTCHAKHPTSCLLYTSPSPRD